MTPEEYYIKFGCIYSESILIDADAPSLRLTNIKHNTPSKHMHEMILQRLMNPRDDIAICYINERLGYALVALQDIPLNPEDNDILFLYAGVVEPADTFDAKHDDYAQPYNTAFEGVQSNQLTITPRKVGGLARFMPHLPVSEKHDSKYFRERFATPEKVHKILTQYGIAVELKAIRMRFSQALVDGVIKDLHQARKEREDEFSHYQFVTPEVEATIATSNCCVSEFVIGDVLVSVAALEHPVKRGQIIGYSYGRRYWETCRQTPELLSQYGQVVPRELYKWQYPSFSYAVHNQFFRSPLSTSELLTQHIKRDSPISTREGFQSVYKLRDILVNVNALPKSYSALPGKSSFILQLEDALNRFEELTTSTVASSSTSTSLPARSSEQYTSEAPSRGYTISSYFSTPWFLYDSRRGCDAGKVNTVIQTHADAKQQQIWDFFQQQTFASRCKRVDETKEIIIENTNDGSPEIQRWSLGSTR